MTKDTPIMADPRAIEAAEVLRCEDCRWSGDPLGAFIDDEHPTKERCPKCGSFETYRDKIAQPQETPEQKGGEWRWVPVKLTEDMAAAMECAFSTEGQWEAALAAAPAMAGEWRWLPVEPTEEIMAALYEAMFDDKYDGTQAPMCGAGYDAMLAAAPQKALSASPAQAVDYLAGVPPLCPQPQPGVSYEIKDVGPAQPVGAMGEEVKESADWLREGAKLVRQKGGDIAAAHMCEKIAKAHEALAAENARLTNLADYWEKSCTEETLVHVRLQNAASSRADEAEARIRELEAAQGTGEGLMSKVAGAFDIFSTEPVRYPTAAPQPPAPMGEEMDERTCALMDGEWLSGLKAGFNAANGPQPNERLAELQASRSDGRLKALKRQPPQPSGTEGEGWIYWNGGKCPVGADTNILIRLRNGTETDTPTCASEWDWHHDDDVFDLVAYRVVKQEGDAP